MMLSTCSRAKEADVLFLSGSLILGYVCMYVCMINSYLRIFFSRLILQRWGGRVEGGEKH